MCLAAKPTCQSKPVSAGSSTTALAWVTSKCPAGREGGAEPAGKPPKIGAVADVIQDLAADDQIEAGRQRVAPHVELAERHVVLPGAAVGGPLQRLGGDVGRDQRADPWRQPDREMPFRASQLECAPDRTLG